MAAGPLPAGRARAPMAAPPFILRLPFPSIMALLVEGPNMTRIFKLLRDKRGATAIEYGLIAALIAVAAITAMTSIGTKLSTTFNNVSSNLG